VKDRFGFILYRMFTAVIGVLPEPVMRRLGEGLGRAAWYVAPGRRRLVQRHLKRVLGQDASVKERSKEMFARYGRYWAEVFWLRPDRKAVIVEHSEIVNGEALQRAKEAGKGIIIVLPHIGNWEVAGAAAESIGVPVLAVAESLPNPLITEWFVNVRKMVGIEIVLMGKGRRSTGELIRRLKEGGLVALLSDRDLAGRGVPVRFFGEETTMPAGPVALADKTGAPIHVVGCYFKDGRGHRFVVGEPLQLPTDGSRAERIAEGTQIFAEALEDVIRVAPEDWHLFVPNWPSDREAVE
jgi:KDO2-lipid IV(A) lauroyltransferase